MIMVELSEEEAYYLDITKKVNSLTARLNEAEKEKGLIYDKKREVEKQIDALDIELSSAVNEMLAASRKVGK
jgi:hypothetical protein